MNDIINIEHIRELCQSGALSWTAHIYMRMIQRNISIADIEKVLMFGEIIERYPEDYPYPSCLILGCAVNNSYIHVVCGISDTELHLITVYYPDIDEWSEDFRIRKEMI